jgi:DNA-binding transcriptional MerR regulator
VEKGPDAFRTISEVAHDLGLPQHVLRFWETRFAQIRPMKRGGGRRYYRPEDVLLLRGIRHLLYEEGYTIHGVQRILRDRGVRHVYAIGLAVEKLNVRLDTEGIPGEELGAREDERAGLSGLLDYLPALLAPRTDAGDEMRRDAELPDPPEMRDEDMEPIPFRRSHAADAPRPAQDEEFAATEGARQSAEAARILRTTLQELSECRRLLDGAREDGR